MRALKIGSPQEQRSRFLGASQKLHGDSDSFDVRLPRNSKWLGGHCCIWPVQFVEGSNAEMTDRVQVRESANKQLENAGGNQYFNHKGHEGT
jgi:hypothetical protein